MSVHARSSGYYAMSLRDQRVSRTRGNRENERDGECGWCAGRMGSAYLVGELSDTQGSGPAGGCGLPPEKEAAQVGKEMDMRVHKSTPRSASESTARCRFGL